MAKHSFNLLECLVLRLGREKVEASEEVDIADHGSRLECMSDDVRTSTCLSAVPPLHGVVETRLLLLCYLSQALWSSMMGATFE